MKWPTVKIETEPEMQRFNRAIELADMLTDYRYDRLPAKDLHQALMLNMHRPTNKDAMRDLELAALDICGGGL